MIDISDPKFIWSELSRRIHSGDHPTSEELANIVEQALLSLGTPEQVSTYVARSIRREPVRGPGTGARPLDRWVRVIRREMEVSLREAAFKAQKIRAPREKALQVVAEAESKRSDHGSPRSVSVESLRRDLRTGLHDAPVSVVPFLRMRKDVDADRDEAESAARLRKLKEEAARRRGEWKALVAEVLKSMIAEGTLLLDPELGFVETKKAAGD